MLTQMDCFGLTNPGLKRPTNQDHYLIADLNKSMRIHDTSLTLDNETRVYGGSQGKLLVVADGMGGEAEGERDCTIAVDQLTTYVLNSPQRNDSSTHRRVSRPQQGLCETRQTRIEKYPRRSHTTIGSVDGSVTRKAVLHTFEDIG